MTKVQKFPPFVAALLQQRDIKNDALRKALEMAQYELMTLSPRLTPQYRKNVEAVLEEIKAALLV